VSEKEERKRVERRTKGKRCKKRREEKTHLVRKNPTDIPKVVAVNPHVRVDLHPATESRNALGANNGIGVAVTVDEDAEAGKYQFRTLRKRGGKRKRTYEV
jgi:CelD/BcsL family acetyltransferase involved in cellulose biosynthesis